MDALRAGAAQQEKSQTIAPPEVTKRVQDAEAKMHEAENRADKLETKCHEV